LTCVFPSSASLRTAGKVVAHSDRSSGLAFKVGWFRIDDIGRLAKMDGDIPSRAILSPDDSKLHGRRVRGFLPLQPAHAGGEQESHGPRLLQFERSRTGAQYAA